MLLINNDIILNHERLVIFFNKENRMEITNKLLLILNVKITTSTLEKDLYDHPDYSSLLSISDVLIGYGVGNICIKSSVDKLSEMPVPFIVPVNSESSNNLFAVIESVNGNTIRYYDPEKHQWENISRDNFEKKCPSGIIIEVCFKL